VHREHPQSPDLAARVERRKARAHGAGGDEFGGDATLKRTWHRIAGTVVGAAIAAVVASVSGSEAMLIAAGLVLAVILVVVALSPHSYYVWTVVVTPVVVLFTSTSIADVKITDAQRLAFTTIGLALILLASGIALAWAHYQQAHPSEAAAVELSTGVGRRPPERHRLDDHRLLGPDG
jgi:uncharacterized membrane protein YccC